MLRRHFSSAGAGTLVLVCSLALAGCGGSNETSTPASAATTTPSTEISPSDTSSPQTSPVATSPPATSGDAETPGTSEVSPDDPTSTEANAEVAAAEPIIAGADAIVTLTPEEVDSLRPTLAWESVDGATAYYLVVLDEVGNPYWVWSGTANETPFGGANFSEFGNGPIVGVGYSWSVTAFDNDGALLAASSQVPISST